MLFDSNRSMLSELDGNQSNHNIQMLPIFRKDLLWAGLSRIQRKHPRSKITIKSSLYHNYTFMFIIIMFVIIINVFSFGMNIVVTINIINIMSFIIYNFGLVIVVVIIVIIIIIITIIIIIIIIIIFSFGTVMPHTVVLPEERARLQAEVQFKTIKIMKIT